jgi:hypothetical protein
MIHINYATWMAGKMGYGQGYFVPIPSQFLISLECKEPAEQITELIRQQSWCNMVTVIRGPGAREVYNITITLKSEYNDCVIGKLGSKATLGDLCNWNGFENAPAVVVKICELTGCPFSQALSKQII